MIELLALFKRATGERLLDAERLIRAWPRLFGEELTKCDLACSLGEPEVFAVAHLEASDPFACEARFAFWTARLAGQALSLSRLGGEERAEMRRRLARSEIQRLAVPVARLGDSLDTFLEVAGAPKRSAPSAPLPLLLEFDLASPTGALIREEGPGAIFVPSPLAPPVGDVVRVKLAVPGAKSTFDLSARVSRVLPPRASAPGNPAGFALSFPPVESSLAEALKSHFQMPQVAHETRRAAPRYAARAPILLSHARSPSRQVSRERLLTIDYSDPKAFSTDFLENLSHGGAFVRTNQELPMGSAVTLEMELPDGSRLKLPATVVHVRTGGVGVQFKLDEESDARLSALMARLATRPQRALVVALEAGVAEALRTKGLEPLTAESGERALGLLVEELFSIDAMVTSLTAPGMSGSQLVEKIRWAGGEYDLAVVVVGADPGNRRKAQLTDMGVDAFVEESAGAEAIANAVTSAIETRRKAPVPPPIRTRASG